MARCHPAQQKTLHLRSTGVRAEPGGAKPSQSELREIGIKPLINNTTAVLIDVNTAAALLGVSAKSVRRWISNGRLEAFRVGPRLLRVRRADVDALPSALPTAGTR